jgi:hypothetical protein
MGLIVSDFPPLPDFIVDFDATALYAGESCGLVHNIQPAAQIVRGIVREAEEVSKARHAGKGSPRPAKAAGQRAGEVRDRVAVVEGTTSIRRRRL